MPRKPTQASETSKWVRAQKGWLTDDHAPMVQQLRMLADTLDGELLERGRVQPATASAYRAAYAQLMQHKPTEQKQREALDAETDSLMSPADWQAGLGLDHAGGAA